MNIRSIVAKHVTNLADAIAKDILLELGGGAPAAPKVPKAKSPKAKPKARAPKASTDDTAVAIAKFVEENPGVGANDIRTGVGIAPGAWARAAKAAVAGGVVRTEGQKRAMKYFPVASA